MKKIVYLDQWAGANLAEADRNPDGSKLGIVLDAIRRARDEGSACFPMSVAHLLETGKRTDPRSRRDLWAFQLELSEGWWFADYRHLAAVEFDEALHYLIPEKVTREMMTPLRLMQEADGVYVIVKLLSLPHLKPTEEAYERGLSELRDKSPGDREASLYTRAARSIAEPWTVALKRHGLSIQDLKIADWKGLRRFLERLPSISVEIHLHRQWLKDRSLPINSSDVWDCAYVGQAAMYCDIVVTDKKFAHLLLADGFRPKARILTKLEDLPGVLVNLN